ncbi:MAG: family 43 glycosylhydrolase [Clostridia bacterium]|nr:family 43 glycosylhydrolase [Clostridia bacterium]
MKRAEIRIRDPFIYTDKKNGLYYMYGTTELTEGYGTLPRLSVYISKDLENFEGPTLLFDGEKENFWATHDYWAAEMHEYKNKYYLFVSLKAEGKRRGTQIFVCDSLDGRFKPLSDKPVTPEEWECLDGTLCVEDGTPYIVFCHEWVQCHDGEICAQALSDDLSTPVGEPFVLFKASDNPHVQEYGAGSGNYVTDGPFLWKENGKLKMIWSSFQKDKYAVFGATADKLCGKWIHTDNLVDFDGGHAMLFSTLDGKRKIALHSPNTIKKERARFFDWDKTF